MIARLRGTLERRDPEGLILDVGGVGYLVSVSLNTLHDLPPLGSEVSLDIHTHVREDSLALYGFGLKGEQALFLHLMNVAGIGPRLALGILSGIRPPDLVQAVLEGQPKRLQQVSGVGKRLAERIIVDLKDKFAKDPIDVGDGVAASGPSGAGSNPLEADLMDALSALGYSKAEISRALKRLPMEDGAQSLQTLIRGALRILSRTS